MTVSIFDKTAAGPTFGPYNAGDVVDLTPTTISHLPTDALHTHPDVGHQPTIKTTKKGDSY